MKIHFAGTFFIPSRVDYPLKDLGPDVVKEAAESQQRWIHVKTEGDTYVAGKLIKSNTPFMFVPQFYAPENRISRDMLNTAITSLGFHY